MTLFVDDPQCFSFQTYVRENLAPAIIPAEDGRLPLLVLDNLRSHWDRGGLLDGVAEKMFTPPMSCQLNNPIETVWSQVKALFLKKQLTDIQRHRDELDFLWDLKQSVKEVVTKGQDGYLRAGNKYVLEYLRVAADLVLEDSSDAESDS